MRFLSASRLLLVLTSTALLAGCASTDPYPETWSEIVAEKGDCSTLVGTFSNDYSKSSSDAITMKGGLIALLLGPASPADAAVSLPVTRVKIEYPSPDRLLVKGYYRKELVREGVRPLARGSCSQKGLPISGKFSGTNAENVLGFVTASGRLQRAENGDLVGRIRSTFTGIALLVPVTASATSWYRFRNIEPKPTTADPVR